MRMKAMMQIGIQQRKSETTIRVILACRRAFLFADSLVQDTFTSVALLNRNMPLYGNESKIINFFGCVTGK